MIATAFYTIGTPYEAEVAALRETLDAHHIPHDLRGLPHPGTWEKACLLFPGFILQGRADHPGEDVLFLDGDARVVAEPTLFGTLAGRFDAALYWLDDSPRSPTGDGRELCTGTTWWAPTPAATEILEAWAEACRDPEATKLVGVDQEVLQLLLPRFPAARIFALPPEYCWMDRISEMHYGKHQPVILHGQASRRFRSKVGVR